MSKVISVYLNEQDGFSAAEYALIIAVVGGGLGVVANVLGSLLSGSAGAIDDVAACIRYHTNIAAC
jgi:pilus assembly protein Flp/PilA